MDKSDRKGSALIIPRFWGSLTSMMMMIVMSFSGLKHDCLSISLGPAVEFCVSAYSISSYGVDPRYIFWTYYCTTI
jgi:hypothetical protein